MGYHTENVCYVVVKNSQVSSYPVRRQIKIQPTHFQQPVFMSTEIYHVLLCMEDIHTKNEQHVYYVLQHLDHTRNTKTEI